MALYMVCLYVRTVQCIVLCSCSCLSLFSCLQLPYIHPLPMAVSSQFTPYPSDSSPYLINAHIGTHVDNRHITSMVYKLGPTYLFDEPLGNMPIHHIYQLGPLYLGSFQNPTQDSMVWYGSFVNYCFLNSYMHTFAYNALTCMLLAHTCYIPLSCSLPI